MDRIRITGGNELRGIIPISGAKNAALPLMIASLLTDDTLTLENVPHLADVEQLIRILGNHGADISVNGRRERQGEGYSRTIHFTSRNIVDTTAPYELVSKMRASFWVIGPLLAREGKARVSLPGGCAIGTRPVDLFIEGLTALGANIEIDSGYINATAPKGGLIGARYVFPKVSVGATHVMMMAATLANGTTVDRQCRARAGSRRSRQLPQCHGREDHRRRHVDDHHRGRHLAFGRAPPRAAGPDRDRHLCHGRRHDRRRRRARRHQCEAARHRARSHPPRRRRNHLDRESGLRVVRNGGGIKPVDIVTDPFPGFPTDLQAQFMGLMTRSSGVSHITETIFENRFMHVQELARLGAKISLSGQTAKIEGVERLKGAPVMATDLRASVSLVIAGLVAEGETMVSRVYHLDRGFERLEEKLNRCGAKVERVSD